MNLYIRDSFIGNVTGAKYPTRLQFDLIGNIWNSSFNVYFHRSSYVVKDRKL